MRIVGIFFCALPLLGQSVRVSSGSAAPGEKVAIEIDLDSPSGKDILALEWEAGFAGDVLKLEGTGAVTGAAGQAAGKTLTCAPKKASGGLSQWVCILAGGQKPIGKGVVAILRFTVQPNAPAGSHPVVLDNVMGVSAALKKVSISRAEGSVRITH
jgi:hypothetical protein